MTDAATPRSSSHGFVAPSCPTQGRDLHPLPWQDDAAAGPHFLLLWLLWPPIPPPLPMAPGPSHACHRRRWGRWRIHPRWMCWSGGSRRGRGGSRDQDGGQRWRRGTDTEVRAKELRSFFLFYIFFLVRGAQLKVKVHNIHSGAICKQQACSVGPILR